MAPDLISSPAGRPPRRTLQPANPLLDRDALEGRPSLHTIKDLRAAPPGGPSLNAEAVLAGLRRNGGLRRPLGIASEDRVPQPWDPSRSEEVLGWEPQRTYLKEVVIPSSNEFFLFE